jgi:glutamate racemase
VSGKPIGVFDSGIGGLTVVKELFQVLRRSNHLRDTARIPYGSKSRETVLRFSWEIAKFLRNLDVKLLVVACNTASALALPSLAGGFDIPILGVIDAGARGALAKTRTRRLGVIGTEATVASRAYADRLHEIDPGATVFAASCPLFVPLAEEGWTDRDVTRAVAISPPSRAD